MAHQPNPTYVTIPPPPLPEFYLTNGNQKPFLSSRSKDDGMREPVVSKTVEQSNAFVPLTLPSVHGLSRDPPDIEQNSLIVPPKQLAATPGDGTDERMKTVRVPPPPPLPHDCNHVPPLAIYHICRICLRPRSARYHREHPIPVNGMPPPPGICRRCRVKPVEESFSVAQVVREDDSHQVKLGVKCLIPDEGFTPRDEMAARRTTALLDQFVRDDKEKRPSSPKRTIYRLITASSSQSEDRTPSPISKRVTRQNDAVYENQENSELASAGHVAEDFQQSPVGIELSKEPLLSSTRTTEKENEREFTVTIKRTLGNPLNQNRNPPAAAPVSAPDPAISPILYPQQNEFDIRRIARDEVVRYRQAERKLNAHRDAYTHGRLIPEGEGIFEEKKGWKRPNSRQEPELSERASATADFPTFHDKESEADSIPLGGWKSIDDELQPQADSAFRNDLNSQNRPRHRRFDNVRYSAREDKVEAAPPSSFTSPTSNVIRGRNGTLDGSRSSKQSTSGTSHRKPLIREGYNIVEVIGFEPSHPREESPRSFYREMRREPKEERLSDASDPIQDLKGSVGGQEHRASSRSSKWSDREYWCYDEPARTAESLSSKPPNSLTTDQTRMRERRDSCYPQARPEQRKDLRNTGETRCRQKIAIDSDAREPAHRSHDHKSAKPSFEDARRKWSPSVLVEDDERARSIPSPYSSRSSAQPLAPTVATRNTSDVRDGEYMYIERTVQPAHRPGGKQPFDNRRPDYEKTTEEYLTRRRAPEPQRATDPKNRHFSAESKCSNVREPNHVRFSNKVDFSPTPPNSDADSSEFRQFGARKGTRSSQHDEDLTELYERRGRERSRVPSRSTYDSEVDSTRYSLRDEGYERDRRNDRDRVSRPMDPRQRRGSPLREPAINARPLARALSESPSRERLNENARRQYSDGVGPYHMEERRSVSLDAEDGSIVSWEEEREQRFRGSDDRDGRRRRS